MLDLSRTHDFQIHLSPSEAIPAVVNPPSFNWPFNQASQQFQLELHNLSNGKQWHWEHVSSPHQLSSKLAVGNYKWRLSVHSNVDVDQVSEWVNFQITEEQPNYVAPSARELFEKSSGRDQWLMYFCEDVDTVKDECFHCYDGLKQTAQLSVPVAHISYPDHYRRGHEEGKREAIANVRKWIDRDLMVHALLFTIWGEEEHGHEARDRLLQIAQWSPEGPASLLRPCTWGDEVGCSLARNLFLAYHWLSPLLNEAEKAFVRPLLIRIAQQISERLSQDDFMQYPGHSHTSRLPAYLGIAALALYREHDSLECEKWLNDALTIYRGVLPFYGGADGSWVEGPFYASTYSKWFHPFFLCVERLSGFSFYEHPFYRNFVNFARDFILPEQVIHPFGDGFWCTREGKEWPGFFSQNPLRIYAARFGNKTDFQHSIVLEKSITDYRLHLLDVVPTIKQLEFEKRVARIPSSQIEADTPRALHNYYSHAGLGKIVQGQLCLYYRASGFGNSSHRHADQGNFAFFDHDLDVLIPTGSYGYRFGSKLHKSWTRQTIAHNLPLIGEQGQALDTPKAIGRVIQRRQDSNYHMVTMDLTDSYAEPLERFHRTLVMIESYGIIVLDSITLRDGSPLNWRLHSSLTATLGSLKNTALLTHSRSDIAQYKCRLLSHPEVQASIKTGYSDKLDDQPNTSIESDARTEVYHLNWQLAESFKHTVIACCIQDDMPYPDIRSSSDLSENEAHFQLLVNSQSIVINKDY